MFSNLEKVLVYIDDIIVVVMGTFKEYIQQLAAVLTKLERKNLQVNPFKSFWVKDKVDYLRFMITRNGIIPQPKKIQGICNLAQPTNMNEWWGSVRVINFYKEMYPQQAHVLQALTEHTGKGRKFEWTSKMDAAFTTVKCLITKDMLLVYPMYRK